MIFKAITFGSDDFFKELTLRNHMLRLPLGLQIAHENLDAERGQLHFGLFASEGELVACVIAAPISPTEAKIRQMAVDARHQGRSHGRTLLRNLEQTLAEGGYRHLWLHARVPAIPFYEKMGYRGVGEEFIEVGIPHWKMEKEISPAV